MCFRGASQHRETNPPTPPSPPPPPLPLPPFLPLAYLQGRLNRVRQKRKYGVAASFLKLATCVCVCVFFLLSQTPAGWECVSMAPGGNLPLLIQPKQNLLSLLRVAFPSAWQSHPLYPSAASAVKQKAWKRALTAVRRASLSLHFPLTNEI